MDNAQDFSFLNHHAARDYNPFQEGEYLVIQTYPVCRKLRVITREYDYRSANINCDIENLAHDYSSFGVRVVYRGKLWRVDYNGNPVRLSEVQDWKIHPDYADAPYCSDDDEAEIGNVTLHECSYPYFLSTKMRQNRHSYQLVEYTQPVACLWDDHGRDIDTCPNCGGRLLEEDEEEDYDDESLSPPPTCRGCSNWHGQRYEGVSFICALHPYGWDGADCPDFKNCEQG